MPSSIATFATLGRTYHKGVGVADDDPAVIALPELFAGVKPAAAATAPKPARKAAPKKETD
jgi:hypothetical protein